MTDTAKDIPLTQAVPPKIIEVPNLEGAKIIITESVWKDYPMLNIDFIAGGMRPVHIGFSVAKAKMITLAEKEIKAFYEKHKDQLNKKS